MKAAQVCVVAIALVAAIVAAQRPAPAEHAFTVHVPVPPSPVLTDGLYRLLYELHLENRATAR